MMKNIKSIIIGFLLATCMFLIMGSDRDQLNAKLDSLKFVNLMSIQDEYRAEQNQLLENLAADYEKAIQDRINDAKIFEDRLFKVLENKSELGIGRYQGFGTGRGLVYMMDRTNGKIDSINPDLGAKEWKEIKGNPYLK